MRQTPPSTLRKFQKIPALRLTMIVLIMVLPFLLPVLSFVRHIDNRFVELRSIAAPRPATGRFVYAAIDEKSLQAVGNWPWSRTVHADLLNHLTAAGVINVLLDIDFSTPSTTEGDARLAAALEDAGGGVILPLFRQYFGAANPDQLHVTAPLPIFAQHAWPALVDVTPDSDGLVRSFPASEPVLGIPTQSAAALLVGSDGPQTGPITIDYSIRPETVPTYSVSDILSGAIATEELDGRSVIVGAHATELKDFFSVPVFGTLSGPMLHILAAETLAQERLLASQPIQLPALLLAALVIIYCLRFHHQSLALSFAAATALIVAAEAIAFLLFKHLAVIVPTTTVWIILAVGLIMQLTERMGRSAWLTELATAENRDIRRILKRVISDSVDPVIILDRNLKLLDASETMRELLELTEPVPRGASLEAFAPPEILAAVQEMEKRHQEDLSRVHSNCVEICLQTSDAQRNLELVLTVSPFETHIGPRLLPVASYVFCLTLRDVTARRRYETRLEEMTRIDDLTGLLSRQGLIQHLEAEPNSWNIFAIDLHRFGNLNATLGREKGDMVLKAVANRIRDHAGINGLAARIDGDVLCCAVPTTTSPMSLEEIADDLITLFRAPFEVGGTKVEINARIGACRGAPDLGTVPQWLEAAEMALDEAKNVAGSGWRAYDPASASRHARSRLLETELKSGLEQGHFFLLYQPQVNLASGHIVGAEALMRWQHPKLGMISPAEFISISEANGFVCDLGRYLLEEACKTAATWPTHLSIAVNASPVQFARGNILEDITHALEISRLAPHRLHLEITESTFLDRSDALIDTLQALRNLGISIALDDFGTGYSSMSYISSLPLNKLKIDQAFVRNMVSDPSMHSIVVAVSTLAHGLGLKVVCEGIETAQQYELLRKLGCEEGQGYLFGKPQSGPEILKMMKKEYQADFAKGRFALV